MDPRALVHFARMKPLLAWSVSGSILGVALALYLTDWHISPLLPTVLAVVAVVLMQYVAHPFNDLMDYELDRQAPIEATGRVKPLVSGAVTRGEVKRLSAVLVIAILAILLYLVYLRPPLALPAAYGMAALMGYNLPAIKLAYRPFTELYLAAPVNAIIVFVISYIGSGQVSPAAVVVSVVFGFAATTFFVSMMSMDLPTDRAHGKITTVGKYPWSYWCALYPAIGLGLALLSPLVLAPELGLLPLLVFMMVSLLTFVPLVAYGLKVDCLRHRYLRGEVADPEGRSGHLRLRQLYISSAFALAVAVLFASRGW